MFKNRLFKKIFHPCVEDIDQVKLVYILKLVVGFLPPVPNDGYYVGFISNSRIYTTYRELLVQFSEE